MALKKFSHNRVLIGTTAELAALVPAQNADRFLYNSETHSMEYCNGTNVKTVSTPHAWDATAIAHTMGIGEYGLFADATSAGYSVTLPKVADVPIGKEYEIIKIAGAAGNPVTLDGDGAETIGGAATKVLKAQYDHIRVVNDGTAWQICDALLTP